MRRFCAIPSLALLMATAPARAAEWFVAPGGTGSGTAASPFGSVQQGLDAAQAGDFVTLRAGTYAETLATRRAGAPGTPITLRAEPGAAEVLISAAGRVLRLRGPNAEASRKRWAYGAPFGGAKRSSYGREHTLQTLREFSRAKTVNIPSGRGEALYWPAVSDVGL